TCPGPGACMSSVFFFQAEDGIRDFHVTGVQTCALPIFSLEGAQKVVPPLQAFAEEGLGVGVVPGRHQQEQRAQDVRVVDANGDRSEERRVGKECRARKTTERYTSDIQHTLKKFTSWKAL